MYPWLLEYQILLNKLYKINKWPHAILLKSKPDLGIEGLVKHATKLLLCQNEKDDTCGICPSCVILNKSNDHPDLIHISPNESGFIQIEKIKSIRESLNVTSHFNRARVIIIDQAEKMNLAAGNALLKTLEEPANEVYFILSSNNTAAIPATILSRCQIFPIKINLENASSWINNEISKQANTSAINLKLLWKISCGMPLKIKQILNDCSILTLRNSLLDDLERHTCPILLAEKLKPKPLEWTLYWLITIYVDISMLHSEHDKNNINIETYINQDKLSQLKNLSRLISHDKSIKIYSNLLTLQQLLDKKININKHLLLENLFIEIGET